MKVQLTAEQVLAEMRNSYATQFDATATKDFGNTIGKASVVVDQEVIVKDAPVPFLLFAEKQLALVKKYIEEIPILDSTESWAKDEDTGLYKTEESKTAKSKKVQRGLILVPATEHHPAQAQLIAEDVMVGYWHTTKTSGAISATRKRVLLDKIDRMTSAFALAREEANDTVIQPVACGDNIFNYLFA